MNTALKPKTDSYFEHAVTRAEIVCDTHGICNLAAIPGAAVEGIEYSHLFQQGDEFYETELSRNLEFAKKLFDLTMNCLDINEDVANRHVRISQIEKMIVSLTDLKRML